jgi:hypothetical protein
MMATFGHLDFHFYFSRELKAVFLSPVIQRVINMKLELLIFYSPSLPASNNAPQNHATLLKGL